MTDMEQAISLIQQGRIKEAQSILKELIRSNPQEISAWFWYVETVNSLEERIHILNVCLKQNPGNPQVTQALQMLQDRQSPARVISSMPSSAKMVRTVSEPKPDETDKSGGMFYGNEPQPAQFTEAGMSDGEQREDGLPNLLIPENEQVLARMKQINVYHELIVPFSWDKVNDNRVHSDYSGVLMDAASDLPANSKYVVYGFPALVHPTTGIIFGHAMGMSIWYRVPDTVAREYREYMDKKYAHLRSSKKKPLKEPAPVDTLPPLEHNWVDGGSFTAEFLHKLYEYYGGRQSQRSVMHLNIEEDLRKEPPPPPFYAGWLDRLFMLLVLLGALVVVALLSDAMNGFRLVRQILDLLQRR